MSTALTLDSILPKGKQAWAIYQATARINLWVGAVRSGKTYGSLWKWLDYVRNGPPGALVMIGRTERTLKRNILDVLGQLLGPSRFRHVQGAGECFIFGRRIYLYSANDEGSKTKIQGLTSAGAYGDEITTWPESFFTMLLSRLSVKGAKFFGTTNPDAPMHWLKRKYIDRESELDLRVFHFTLPDNPSLDPAYVEALKKEYVGLWYRRYIQGLWALAEGAVFDMFDEARHVVREIGALGRSLGGADYGTSNPTVFLRLSNMLVANENAELNEERWLIHDEWRWDSGSTGKQMTDGEYSAAYRSWTHEAGMKRGVSRWPEATVVDPSAASFRLQLAQDGVPGVTEADNAVLDGIRDVSTFLANDQLAFHGPSMIDTVDEMMGYVWDEKAQARGEDKPVKRSDHGPDTVRYLVRHLKMRPPVAFGGSDANVTELYGQRRSVWA